MHACAQGADAGAATVAGAAVTATREEDFETCLEHALAYMAKEVRGAEQLGTDVGLGRIRLLVACLQCISDSQTSLRGHSRA
jgi:hypothetical protein